MADFFNRIGRSLPLIVTKQFSHLHIGASGDLASAVPESGPLYNRSIIPYNVYS
jgi:hypothetical protein